MPEGDSVRREAARLHRALSGSELVAAELRWGSLGGTRLAGRRILATVSVGKHLLTRLAAAPGRPALTLHTHLRMEGRWRIRPASDPHPAARSGVRVLLVTESCWAAGFHLGRVDLVPSDQEHRLVGHLGPDVLGPNWDPAHVLARLGAIPTRPLGEALLDQRVVAGLGTWWVSEVLFLQGMSPTTPVQHAAALPRLVERLPDLLGVPTRPAPRVYGLRGRRCPRCGATIGTVVAGTEPTARTLFRCPGCQPEPEPPEPRPPGPRPSANPV